MIKGKTTKMTAVFIFMAIVFVISAYPFYAMIINATSTNKEIFSGVPKFLPSTHLVSNFIELNQRIPIIRNLMNSIFVSFKSVITIIGKFLFLFLISFMKFIPLSFCRLISIIITFGKKSS